MLKKHTTKGTDLIIKNPNVPLRAIPEAELNTIVLTVLKDWLIDLLSLTSEDMPDHLDMALPALKKHCWSMGFNEIKKMFEMYADGQLSMKPRSNYFDRILVGQIFNDYKKQLPQHKNPIKTEEISDNEKEFLWMTHIINCFEQYKHDGKMLTGSTAIYDEFHTKGKFPKHTKAFHEKIRKQAIVKLKSEEGIDYSEGAITVKCKEIILGDFFNKITDIKDEL